MAVRHAAAAGHTKVRILTLRLQEPHDGAEEVAFAEDGQVAGVASGELGTPGPRHIPGEELVVQVDAAVSQ